MFRKKKRYLEITDPGEIFMENDKNAKANIEENVRRKEKVVYLDLKKRKMIEADQDKGWVDIPGSGSDKAYWRKAEQRERGGCLASPIMIAFITAATSGIVGGVWKLISLIA